MANIVVSDITSTSITLYVNELDTTYDRADRYIKWRIYPSTTVVATSYLGANVSSGGTTTITGLSPNTAYQISAELFWTDGTTGEWDSKIILSDAIKTNSAGTKPSKWSWTNSNGTATAEQTQKAYTAVTTKGKTTDFSYLVWNDIVDKVNEIHVYSNIEWFDNFNTLENTKMTSTDKEITANRYNSLLFNIWNYGTTFVASFSTIQRKQGDEILGSYFIDIVDYINNLIDLL